MKAVGYILIAAGFLAGALISVVDPEHVVRHRLAIALAVGFTGVALVRIAGRQKAGGEHRAAAGVQQLLDLLERIVANMRQLRDESGTINTYDMRHRLDALIAGDVNSFAEGRHSITAMSGLGTYAEIMGHFAAGERYMNRVWSASADGYVDEVNTCMEKSEAEFARALRFLQEARARGV